LDNIGKKAGFRDFQVGRAAAPRGRNRVRAVLLVPVLASAILVAATAGFPAFSYVGLRMLIAALKDPLALLSERSPGNRTGHLISIKGKTGPSERVLSSVRDRPGANAAPVLLDIPAGTLAPPQFQEAQLAPGGAGGTPFVPASPFGSSPVTPGGVPAAPSSFFPPTGGFVPGTTPSASTPGTSPPGGTPPGGTPPGGTTPGGTPPGETPPGGTPPGDTPPGGGIIVVPEPAPWTMMVLGLIATGTLRRRRTQG